jgi:hypothetical protein
MKPVFRILMPLLVALPGIADAQEWDIRVVLKEISAHAGRLGQFLEKTDPTGWVEKGVPDTYVAQWKSLTGQARGLSVETLELAGNPERLAPALKTFFRMQSLEFMLGSFAEGVRRYQDAGQANALIALGAENGVNRERLQSYIVDLASEREKEYEIMDREAQRCRGMLVRQPPAAKSGPAGRK